MDPEKRASWKWAKRKAWAYENKCGNSRGPECVQEKLPVDRCGFERKGDLGSVCQECCVFVIGTDFDI